MLIQDSDQPAIWYHRVKKAWAESVENGTDFVNPVQERDPALAKLTLPIIQGLRPCPARTKRSP